MATGTNGIATCADVSNMVEGYPSTNQCVIFSSPSNTNGVANACFSIAGSYSEGQCVKYSDITSRTIRVSITIKNNTSYNFSIVGVGAKYNIINSSDLFNAFSVSGSVTANSSKVVTGYLSIIWGSIIGLIISVSTHPTISNLVVKYGSTSLTSTGGGYSATMMFNQPVPSYTYYGSLAQQANSTLSGTVTISAS